MNHAAAPYALALDLGGSQLRAALVDRTGAVLARHAEATSAQSTAMQLVEQMAKAAVVIARGVPPGEVAGIGLSSPGPLDTQGGIALGLPTLPALKDFPMRAALEDRLQARVVLENDAISAAFGEWRFGAGRGLQHCVYVTVSTGIGGGVVADGRLLHGRKGMACHIGHMLLVHNGAPCPCGRRGCFEAYASGRAFEQRATMALPADEATDPAAVFAKARHGHAMATQLVAEEADFLGAGLVSLLHLYSPEVIILGGGMANDFDLLLPGIHARIATDAMEPFRDVPVVQAALKGNAGLIGAAALVFEND
jgi:glucokinase